MKRRRVTACTLFEVHGRSFPGNRYVYPVLSRRAGGLSIGVNLNRDKSCNFRCIYCQVDRSQPGQTESVDAGRLADELEGMIDLVTSGRIFQESTFGQAPAALHRLNDIALSGDGEPTTHPDFELAVDTCAEVRRRHHLGDAKLVLITNASMFHHDAVRGAIAVLDANGGEIWAKLDAGTEDYYRGVNRSAVPFQRILENLVEAARVRPIVVQTLFGRMRGQGPSDDELAAYGQRLLQVIAGGGRIKCVQVHTVARRPAEPWVEALAGDEIDAIGRRIRHTTGLPVDVFHG
jgi:wyosine [tRNA(Phe)-imidazoG37] synthetase (radical SAM superfamily)